MLPPDYSLFNLSLSVVAQCYHLAQLHRCSLVFATIKVIALLDESPLSVPEIKRPLPLICCPICGDFSKDIANFFSYFTNNTIF
jgi:hypothetical protein